MHPSRSTQLFAFLALLTSSISTALTLPLNRTNPTAHPPNFRLIIAAAVRSVQHTRPSAQLTRIECTSAHGPTLSPYALTDIRLFFRYRSPHAPAILLSSLPDATAWGQWAQPHLLTDPRPETEQGLGDILTSDVVQVVHMMRAAGQTSKFYAVDVLREEGMTEAWWSFQMSGRGSGWVWVGDESGRVEVEEDGIQAGVGGIRVDRGGDGRLGSYSLVKESVLACPHEIADEAQKVRSNFKGWQNVGAKDSSIAQDPMEYKGLLKSLQEATETFSGPDMAYFVDTKTSTSHT